MSASSSRSALPDGVITPGTRLRDAALLDPHGADTTLAAERGEMRENHDLQYSVVWDAGNTLARAAGILTAPSDDARPHRWNSGST